VLFLNSSFAPPSLTEPSDTPREGTACSAVFPISAEALRDNPQTPARPAHLPGSNLAQQHFRIFPLTPTADGADVFGSPGGGPNCRVKKNAPLDYCQIGIYFRSN
jgi:hypothetical protein